MHSYPSSQRLVICARVACFDEVFKSKQESARERESPSSEPLTKQRDDLVMSCHAQRGLLMPVTLWVTQLNDLFSPLLPICTVSCAPGLSSPPLPATLFFFLRPILDLCIRQLLLPFQPGCYLMILEAYQWDLTVTFVVLALNKCSVGPRQSMWDAEFLSGVVLKRRKRNELQWSHEHETYVWLMYT